MVIKLIDKDSHSDCQILGLDYVNINSDGFHCHDECETTSMANAHGAIRELWSRVNAVGRRPTLIRKVPEVFRQKESFKGCFDPRVVSIGPHHHGNSKLQEMERIKYSLTRDFAKNEEKFRNLYNEVGKIHDDARRYYPEETVSMFDRNAFTTLMLVDGCFVLQFINRFMNNNQNVEHMKSNIAAFLRRDLMLLENQLPYIVLEKLMTLRFGENHGYQLINNFIHSFRGDLSPQTTRIQATFKFFDTCCSILKDPCSLYNKGTANQTVQQNPESNNTNQPPQQQNPANNLRRPLHLLDIFLSKYINKENLRRQSPENGHRHWYSYPAAKELRTQGIHFRRSALEHFNLIEFRSTPAPGPGFLFLPQIMIDDTTKPLLLNLVAYEASPDAPDDLCGLSSYICFMDSLIDQAEDVKVLRSKGIVFNLLGSDQQAAELFNDIAQGLAPKHDAFCDIRERIEDHSRSRIKTWMAVWINAHFSRPWTIFAFIAAAATTVMTLMQTCVAVLEHCKGKDKAGSCCFCAFFNNSRA